MQPQLGVVACLLALAVAGRVGADSALPAARDWQAIQELITAAQTKAGDQDPYAHFVAMARQRDELHHRLQDYRHNYPTDQHRAEATFQLLMRPPACLLKLDPARFAREGASAALYDVAAINRWEREAREIKAAFLAERTTRAEWRQDILRRDLYLEGRDACDRIQRGEKVDLAPLRARLGEWLTAFPMSERAVVPVESYMRALALNEPGAVEEEWTKFSQNQNPVLQELAAGQLLVWQSKRKPLDWKFTALDGRTVDLPALRGKMVLVDFWATWCGPCIAEMPELKRIYARFHDQGFEMIGIALDSMADRRKLEQFVATHAIPWPQHFDGGGRRNAYAVRYGIKSVPTKILLDRAGRVIIPRMQTDELEATLVRCLNE